MTNNFEFSVEDIDNKSDGNFTFIVKFEPDHVPIGILKKAGSDLDRRKSKKRVRFNNKVKVKSFLSKRGNKRSRFALHSPSLNKRKGCAGGKCNIF